MEALFWIVVLIVVVALAIRALLSLLGFLVKLLVALVILVVVLALLMAASGSSARSAPAAVDAGLLGSCRMKCWTLNLPQEYHWERLPEDRRGRVSRFPGGRKQKAVQDRAPRGWCRGGFS